MTETVCVTVEQLRDIERGPGDACPICGITISSLQIYETDEHGQIRYAQCGLPIKIKTPIYRSTLHETDCWIGNAIAQAERLKDWKPEVRDRVRLKAMPEAGPFLIAEIDPTQTLFTASRKVKLGWRDQFGDMYPWESRYLAELMPEEETK